jgi:cytochrome c-type biogenesis protein CcmH/NrfG
MRSGQKSVSRRADKRRASGTDKSTAPLVTAPRVLLVLALALAVLSHIAALGFAFVDDDTTQVIGEPHIQSWQFLPQYFTQDIWLHKCGSNYYRPLFLTWLLLNYMFFGLEPLGWHAAVLLVHALATALVYVLVAKLWQDPLTAGFAAVLFAVHPVAVEGVAWVAGANEPLMTVMFLVSLLCYLHARERGQKLWVWSSALCYLAALLVKETAIILPLLVLIYEAASAIGRRPSAGDGRDYGRTPKAVRLAAIKQPPPGHANLGSLATALVPYAAAVLVYLGARGLALHGLAPAHRSSVSLVTVFSTWPAILWFYVKELIIPWPLGLYHTLPFVTQYRMGNFFGPLLGLIAIGAGLAAWSRREPRVGQTCAWLFLPLLPVMTSVAYFDRGQLVHDRYLYLPMVGMVMLGALALRRVKLLDMTRFGLPLTQVVILSAVVCIFGIATVAQTGTWRSNQALYRHAVAVAPDSAPANVAWAQELSAEDQPEAALRYYRQALALDPDDFRTYYSLGFFQAHSQQWEDAEKSLVKVTQLKPQEPCIFFGLALVQKAAGKLPEAEASFRRACSTSPVPEGAHFQLASLLESQGRLREAREELEAELAIGPDPRAEREIEELDQQGNRQTK